MLTPVKLDSGVPLRFHSKEGRETTASVVSCQPMGSDNRSWRLGARLDQPENFWGLRNCPKDWALPATTALASHRVPNHAGPSSEGTLDRVVRQLEAPLKRMIAQSVGPLQAELAALKEQWARREANPSRFDVSLSSIPPELEQQLELRLRKDLGPKVLDEARQQSAHLLSTAKATLDQRTTESHEEFMRRAAEELKVVEQRAQDISAHISANAREHLSRGLDEFHQKLLDGGNSLKRLSEELLQFLQHNLKEEHDAARGDLEQLRASAASESSRLQEHIAHLDNRIAKLNESVCSMESDLDQRLSQMASNLVRDMRGQLKTSADDILEELTTRSVKQLGDQLDEASRKMKTVQSGIVASVSDSVTVQAAEALQSFEHSMEELARFSVERWRLKLAGGLNALAKNLGQQFPLEAEPADKDR